MYTVCCFSLSFSIISLLIGYKQQKRRKKLNDSLPSFCRSSLMRLSFDRKLFSLTSIKYSLSRSLFLLYKMCSICFSSLHAPRLMFIFVRLTLLNIRTTIYVVVVTEEEQEKDDAERDRYINIYSYIK
jgi:hypothetical protein